MERGQLPGDLILLQGAVWGWVNGNSTRKVKMGFSEKTW